MPDFDVPLQEFLRSLSVVVLVFVALLVPLSMLTPRPIWVLDEAQAIAVTRATATAVALSGDATSSGTAGEAASSAGGDGQRGQRPDFSLEQAAANAVAGAAVVDRDIVDRIVPGVVAGTTYDALNGRALQDVRIAIRAANRVAISSPQGRYNLRDIPAGRYLLEVTLTGYIPVSEAVEVSVDGIGGINFMLSPVLREGQLRIVLTWGQSPKDLDAHLWFPPGRENHVYHPSGHRAALDGSARLDTDARTGQGPETITIDRFYTGPYIYAVEQYSSEGSLARSDARVVVYSASGQLQTFTPPQGDGRWWLVFTIDGGSRELKAINTLGNTNPEPYP